MDKQLNNKIMKTTTINCPVCGTTMEISINTKNTKNMKAQERIEALRKAGVNVDNLFTLAGANGGEYIAANKNGHLTILNDDDPIFQKIMADGAIPNRKLFRRWVMAQMFRNLIYKGYDGKIGITAAIQARGYDYQWKMTLNEIHAINKMCHHQDMENYSDRYLWFNKDLLIEMAIDYVYKVQDAYKAAAQHLYKKRPYRNIGGYRILEHEFYNEYIPHLNELIDSLRNAYTLVALELAFMNFNNARYKLPSDTPQCKAWINAYKGSGAFFTMQNMIRFHNCKFKDSFGQLLSKEASYNVLLGQAEKYQKEGWRMVGLLKQLLADNNINIALMMASWSK